MNQTHLRTPTANLKTMAELSSPIEFESLPVEILQNIYEVCSTIADVIALSSTCKKTHRAFQGSRKLPIIESIIKLQYGPIADAISVVTYNATNSQITHSMSLALAKQIDQIGRVANQWADLYPMEKWKGNYESRRLLTSYERYKLRRAVYRIWFYSKKFDGYERIHNYDIWGSANLSFLANYPSKEAEEMLDMDFIFGAVLADLCPHNGIISLRARDRYPTHQLYFSSSQSAHLGATSIEYESWGDLATVEKLIGALKKLNPRQLLLFKELGCKRERMNFIKEMDEQYGGHFEEFTSSLRTLLPTYLFPRSDLDPDSVMEEVFISGGIIAADE